jgi:hypothetical protein
VSIGPDLKEVLEEVGLDIIIERYDGTVIEGEYLDYEINRQVTKPFIREFFLEGFVSYDTELQAGDYIVLAADGRRFLVMNLTPELFENEVIKYDCVLYKCNEQITIQRKGGPGGFNANYQRNESWQDVATDVWILLTERFYGASLTSAGALNELMEFEMSSDQIYLPAGFDIQTNDRIIVSPEERYHVEFVEFRKFDGVVTCTVKEDQRG